MCTKLLKGIKPMKEQIYTIPINEAVQADTECPFCMLYRKCEDEAVDYVLGAAMMEPDFRIESNEKGYCNKHFEMMLKKPNKLSLALVMETHLAEIEKSLHEFEKAIGALKGEKKGLFKKGNSGQIASEMAAMLKKNEESCIICDKINYTMGRYISVFADMWCTEPEFRKKVEASKGFCLPHMRMLLEASERLSERDRNKFMVFLYEKQKAELARITEDVHKFTLKFDYRNKDMDWGSAADAPLRSIEKVAGAVMADE